jgi:hypothetical protein
MVSIFGERGVISDGRTVVEADATSRLASTKRMLVMTLSSGRTCSWKAEAES